LPVEASSFLDFSRQVYRDLATIKKTWTVALNLLDADEVARLKAFFEQQQGRYGTFTFVDPVDSSVHNACSFAEDTFTQHQSTETSNQNTLTIYEHA
jgi:hypothetical protein